MDNTEDVKQGLVDVLRLYFELKPLADDVRFVAGNGHIEYTVDSNVLIFCQKARQDKVGHVPLISGEEGQHLAQLYVRHLAWLLMERPKNDIDSINPYYGIFLAHRREFDRWHLNALDEIDNAIEGARQTIANTATRERLRQAVAEMYDKHHAGWDIRSDYERLRREFPDFIDMVSGQLIAAASVTPEALTKSLPDIDVNETLDVLYETISSFMKSSTKKSIKNIRSDIEAMINLITANYFRIQQKKNERVLFLTFDLDLIALRHAFESADLYFKGFALADLCCTRDARLIPFMPGFDWASRDTQATEKLLSLFMNLQPLIEQRQAQSKNVDFRLSCVPHLWFPGNDERKVALSRYFGLHPPESDAVASLFLSRQDEQVWQYILTARRELLKALELVCLTGTYRQPGNVICNVVTLLCEPDVMTMFVTLATSVLQEAVRVIRRARWIGPDALLKTAIRVKLNGERRRRMPLLLLSMSRGYFSNLMRLADEPSVPLAAIADIEDLDDTEITLAIAYLMALDGQWDKTRSYCEEMLLKRRSTGQNERDTECYIEANIMAATAIRLSASEKNYIGDMASARQCLENAIKLLDSLDKPNWPKNGLVYLALRMEMQVNWIFVQNHMQFCDIGGTVDAMSCRDVLAALSKLYDTLSIDVDAGRWEDENRTRAKDLMRNLCLNICSTSWVERFIIGDKIPETQRLALNALTYIENNLCAHQSDIDKTIVLMARWWLFAPAEQSDETARELLKIRESAQPNLLHYEHRKYARCAGIIERTNPADIL